MPDKTKLLIANEFHPETVEELDAQFECHKLWLLPPPDQKDLIDQLKPDCKAVATASWATNPLIYDLPELEIISCFGVGVNGIDFETTRSRHIFVTNTPKVLNDAVADIAVSLILATQRNLINADRFVRDGLWLEGSFPFGNSLAGKTLGILGLGNIGEEIVKRALPLKLKIAYHNRHRKNLPYPYYANAIELAANCDILLCMLPGGKETDKLVNREVLENLGPEGTFINVGRGSSVDDEALIWALQSKTIAGAALDVYNNEPHVHQELLAMKNVILLPHIGSATIETRTAMGQLVIDNLLAWAQRKPLLTPVE
ncbi:MAG: 2-hydroxyacid dehydrogenase [Gammaproteobacteria bacterium]|nr:2-hydroxyacid dehydrogenase [Gammaproteobacteria bacterium]